MYAIVRDVNGAARDMQTYSVHWTCHKCSPPATSIKSPQAGDTVALAEDWQANPAQTPFTVESGSILTHNNLR